MMKEQLLKIVFAVAAVAIALSGICFGQDKADQVLTEKMFTCPSTATTPTIDGLADIGAYSDAQVLENYEAGAGATAEDLSAEFKACWDAQYFYLFVSITDDVDFSLPADSTGSTHTFDNAELFWNPDIDTIPIEGNNNYGTDAIQLRFNRGRVDETAPFGDAHGVWDGKPEYKREGTLFTTVSLPTGWAAEARVPWEAILPDDLNAYVQVVMGFEVSVGDADDGTAASGNRDIIKDWANNLGVGNQWLDTRYFGRIKLENTAGIVAVDNNIAEMPVVVYPNPASESVNFVNVLNYKTIEIIDVLGQVLKTVDISTNSVTIDVTDLTSGSLFIARIADENGNSVLKRFIVK